MRARNERFGAGRLYGILGVPVADRRGWSVLVLMAMTHDSDGALSEFSAFVGRVEPRLRQALVATYGPADGREATVDALSWAWEHWDQLAEVANQAGYLYRVGQSAVRRFRSDAVPWHLDGAVEIGCYEFDPGLAPALDQLSSQQRTIVLLVHAHGWSQAEVARTLEINPSTVREHLDRAMSRLRNELEAHDVH